jgi:SNF2 family DNA or RNA helicase
VELAQILLTARYLTISVHGVVGDMVDSKEVVPLSQFVCGDVGPADGAAEESCRVRSESESADSHVDEEEEILEEDDVSSDDDGEHDLELNDATEEEGKNDVTVAKESERPRRTARSKVNYAIDTVWSDDEDEDAMFANSKRSGGKRGYQVLMSDSEDDELMEEESTDTVAPGGLASVESILHSRKAGAGKREMRVKYKGKSYRKTEWVDRDDLFAMDKGSLIRGYEKRLEQGKVDPYGDLEDGIHPDWLVAEKIVTENTKTQEYLVKWCGLNYSECTWETAEDLASPEDQAVLARYEENKKAEAEKLRMYSKNNQNSDAINLSAVPQFENGRKLRDYQVESLKWMSKNWYTGRNCILGDEMGLGKTAQSIATLEFQRQFGHVNGPFLVIAPLTTLGHWKREIETWTKMNCVLYCGTAEDKKVIHKWEIWCNNDRKTNVVKPDVILSSYEHIMRDGTFFQNIEWETMIIDEAHRMKGTKGSTRNTIAAIPCQWILLLTGTPVQNNVRELFGILNLLDPEKYDDEDDFLERFGRSTDKMSPEQVVELQNALKPILLRRMKEDVETLPEKEECIIWVQLTQEQRAYYKAIFENQIGVLLSGASTKNVPALRNVAMELRKVCCHPFLCDGVEDDLAERHRKKTGEDMAEVDLLVSSCGKMQLLHKLLPKLRQEKRKVLIFSQFKIMLNVLEDYANLMGFPVERIDGNTSSRDRQAAIDRYSSSDKDGFIFLLSTKAGGQGITLTAADTCILYDSDWNPQNDLQAMARCHRIGQTKDVTIYRLVSKNTYEENLFHASSRKYGLDEAILGGMAVQSAGQDNPEYDGKRISELLKHGAHCLKMDEKAEEETNAFQSENIDEILSSRTEKRQIGGRAGNTFSVASFEGEKARKKEDDQEFWKTLLPEAYNSFEDMKRQESMPQILPPRKKRAICYNEMRLKRGRPSSQDDYEFDFSEDEMNAQPMKKPQKKPSEKPKKSDTKRWTISDVNTLFDCLLRFGMDMESFLNSSHVDTFVNKKYPKDQVERVAKVLRTLCEDLVNQAPKKPKRRTAPFISDEQKMAYEDSHADFEKAVETILSDIPSKIKSCSEWEDIASIQALHDKKLPEWIVKNAEKVDQHVRGMTELRSRLANYPNVPLPYFSNKKVPTLWIRDRVKLDTSLLRAICKAGWDLRNRGSKITSEVVSILKEDEAFFSLRIHILGTSAAPPLSEQLITVEAWKESSNAGYDKLAQLLVNRIKDILAMLAIASEKIAGPSDVTPGMRTFPFKTVQPRPFDETVVPDAKREVLKTPGSGASQPAIDVFKENTGKFTGPTPTAGDSANSPVKQPGVKQRSIFEVMRIKKVAQPRIAPLLETTNNSVDIDLTDSP